MPDLSSPQTCFKPYENRPHRLIENPFLPTLKPEEPIYVYPRVVNNKKSARGFLRERGTL
jgi:hypothetical protein